MFDIECMTIGDMKAERNDVWIDLSVKWNICCQSSSNHKFCKIFSLLWSRAQKMNLPKKRRPIVCAVLMKNKQPHWIVIVLVMRKCIKSVFSAQTHYRTSHISWAFLLRDDFIVYVFFLKFLRQFVLVKPDTTAKKIPCDYQELQVIIKIRVLFSFATQFSFISLIIIMDSKKAHASERIT